jgi:hypothetical protein
MHRSAPNDELFPIRPSPTIPVDASGGDRGDHVADSDERGEDRRATDPDLVAVRSAGRRVHPPEELFGMRASEHVALPVQRNNLYIAVAAFVFMLLLALFAAFFRHRLQLERGGVMDVSTKWHAPP